MFFNTQNAGFPFRMPGMGTQMPFTPFPFPSPFNYRPAADQTPAEGEDTTKQQPFNPFNWYQMPQMEQFQELFKKMFPVAGMHTEQGFNPFAWCPMPPMPSMEQFQDMFKKMYPMNNPQAFNPFAWWPMPQMEQFQEQLKKMFPMANAEQQTTDPFGWCKSQMDQALEMQKKMLAMMGMNEQSFDPRNGCQIPQLEPLKEMHKKMLEKFNVNGENGLPFGMPVKFLQVVLNMDSNPDGLSKFQKILDMIFDSYSKAKTAPEEPAPQEPDEVIVPAED